MLCG
jgi:OTU domain-containing protein 6